MLDTLRVDVVASQPAPWPFLHPGRSAEVLAGDVRAGLRSARCIRSSRAHWDIEQPVAAFALDLGKLTDAVARAGDYADVVELPAAAPGPRRDPPDRRPRAAARPRSSARRAGRCSPAPRSSTSTRAPRWARGGGRWRFALTFRAADRTLTDEDVAPVRDAIVAALRDELGGELRGVRPVAGRRRRRATRARWPPASCTATRTSSSPPSPSRIGRGHAAERPLPAPPRAAGARGARPRPPRATSTPPSSPTRTARRRRSSPSCASAACASSTSAPTSGCATARPTSSWYGEHEAPGAVRRRRLRPARSCYRDADRRRRPRRRPRLLPDGGDPRRWRRWRAPGSIADVVIDAKSGVSGAGRGATQRTHFVPSTRTCRLQGRGSPPRAGDRPGAARGGRAGDVHLHAAPRSRSTRASCCPAT